MSLVNAVKCCIAAVAAGLLVAACADDIGPAPANFVIDSAPSALGASYRLGIGDKLKITVFGEDSLSGAVEVNAAGQVALPLAGEVPAQGKTLSQFRETVVNRLGDGYLKNPKVTVEITNYRPFYIHGEVKNGGEFAYKTQSRSPVGTRTGPTRHTRSFRERALAKCAFRQVAPSRCFQVTTFESQSASFSREQSNPCS
jgi:hypothetical protein